MQTLAAAPDPRGGTWSPSGVIVFAKNIEDGLYQVSTTSGDATRVTTLNKERGENSHRWPQFLPDGKRILYLARSVPTDHHGIYVGTPGSNDWKLLLRTTANALVTRDRPKWLPALFPRSGQPFLLFMRGQTLTAQRLDLDRVQLTGEPIPVADPVPTYSNRGAFSAADTASLIYQAADRPGRLVLVDRSGKAIEPGIAGGSYPRFSPAGTQIVYVKVDPSTLAGDIWMDDLSRQQSRRLTLHPGYDWTPLWSPDGNEVAFATNRHGAMDLYAAGTGRAGVERSLFQSDRRKIPTDWSRDGKFLLFQQEEPSAGWDLWALPLDGGQPFPVARSPSNEVHGVFSPDGRWVAYTTDESGEEQVHVVPFDPASASSSRPVGKSHLVSTDGDSQPRWPGSGKELFYRTRDGKLTVVQVSSGSEFVFGRATPLFDTIIPPSSSSSAAYDVTPDGVRFVIRVRGDETVVPYTLFVNWTTTAGR